MPGVRENGGQYTHAAIWAAMAFAAAGDGRRAWEIFTIINPVNHALTPTDAETYKVEPYVVAADVYAAPAHLGRGGWTWYTGSAGWMYQAAVEALLGLRRQGATFSISPCIPARWPKYSLEWKHGRTLYRITVLNPDHRCTGVGSAEVDGVPADARAIPLVDHRGEEARTPIVAPPLVLFRSLGD